MSAIEKLATGDMFPQLKLKAAGGDEFVLPDDINSDYAIVLFYRGHWWPFCRRLLDGYENLREDFAKIGATIYAGTVDSEEKTSEVAGPLNFPVAHSMSRADGDAIGAWWDERRDHIQPSEFVLNGKGRVMASTYSNSPVGRMDSAETLTLLQFLKSMAEKKNG